jgi:predicted esterase
MRRETIQVDCPLRRALALGFGMLLWASGVTSQPVYGQLFRAADRYELGQRLRRFELAWQDADETSRQRSVVAMESAVNSFFRFQLGQAGGQLDQAYLAVRSADAPTPVHRWALSQRLEIEPLVADATCAAMRLQLADFYSLNGDPPGKGRINVRIVDADERTVAESSLTVEAARQGYQWDTGPVAAGDLRVVATLVDDQQSFNFASKMISRADQWESRLESVADAIAAVQETASPTGSATLSQLRGLLDSLRRGMVQETDYPAASLLAFCEQLVVAEGRSERVLGTQRGADCWVTLSNGRQSLPVRLRVPQESDEPLPVLIALHGAGGSENMFFETYGAGRLVQLGSDRGWLVVAPRQGLLGLSMDYGAMLDVLAEHFPIDRRRVFLVGHSMGAAQVVTQVTRQPAMAAAAVALGGGRGAPDASAVKEIPWFVAAGERDFGRRGAQSLARALESAGARVTWREYPQVEHMVIVQAALDDVFAFLDSVSQSSTPLRGK